jgi:phospholipid/cholesterol/gamma-HCH transport system ATP-binding protein
MGAWHGRKAIRNKPTAKESRPVERGLCAQASAACYIASVEFIEFQEVAKRFGPKTVYRDLNLAVRRGESITIIGGSGQGKSVMLKLLIGLLKCDGGQIYFDGQEVSGLDERALIGMRRRVGMLFQGAALFDSMTVRDNIAYGLREHLRLTEREIGERVKEALELVGLPGTEAMWPADLSGGMRKRVGLARAIAIRPEVLLYDEPTTGLDPLNTSRIDQLILSLKRSLNVTSIVVTHDMRSAFTVSDRIAMVHDGQIIYTGTPDEIRRCNLPQVRDFIEGRAPLDTGDPVPVTLPPS